MASDARSELAECRAALKNTRETSEREMAAMRRETEARSRM